MTTMTIVPNTITAESDSSVGFSRYARSSLHNVSNARPTTPLARIPATSAFAYSPQVPAVCPTPSPTNCGGGVCNKSPFKSAFKQHQEELLRPLTPASQDVFNDMSSSDEEDQDSGLPLISEPAPWLFQPIEPAEDEADYDPEVCQIEEQKQLRICSPAPIHANALPQQQNMLQDEDAWNVFMSGVPMEIEFSEDEEDITFDLTDLSSVSDEQIADELQMDQQEGNAGDLDLLLKRLRESANELNHHQPTNEDSSAMLL